MTMTAFRANSWEPSSIHLIPNQASQCAGEMELSLVRRLRHNTGAIWAVVRCDD